LSTTTTSSGWGPAARSSDPRHMARSRALWKVTSTTATAAGDGAGGFGSMSESTLPPIDGPGGAPAGGHVVLCGLNELGYRTLEELARLGVEVVVVVRSAAEELARGARELGATLVPGSYRDQRVLRAAGVPTAGALVITEDDDVGTCTPPWPPRS
jgi:hypothetical protein